MLQAGHVVPPIWHAAVALGALHEKKLRQRSVTVQKESTSTVPTIFHLVQYSKALNGLRNLLHLPKVPLNLILICTLLLVHFEALRDEHASALSLIENTLRVLHHNNENDFHKPNGALLRALQRIDDQGFLRKGMTPRKPVLVFDLDEVSQDVPAAFTSLAQAKDLITSWICCQCHFMLTQAHFYKFQSPGDVPLEVVAQMSTITASFRQLGVMLGNDFTNSPHSRSRAEQYGVSMLRSWTILATIIGATSAYAEAAVYDLYVNDFRRIIDLCSTVLNGEHEPGAHCVVPIDEGVLHPLFFTAVNCRDSSIRRAALSLLEKLPREIHIVWDVDAVLEVARFCVDFEESQCEIDIPTCHDIFEWKRIHNVTLELSHLQGSKRTLLVKLWLRPNGMDGEWASIVHQLLLEHHSADTTQKYVPVSPYAVWWQQTRPTSLSEGSSIVTAETAKFDTTPYRLAYLEAQKRRLESSNYREQVGARS